MDVELLSPELDCLGLRRAEGREISPSLIVLVYAEQKGVRFSAQFGLVRWHEEIWR